MKYEIYYNGAQVYPYDPCEFDNREDAEYQLKCMIEVDGYKPGELEIVETHDDEREDEDMEKVYDIYIGGELYAQSISMDEADANKDSLRNMLRDIGSDEYDKEFLEKIDNGAEVRFVEQTDDDEDELEDEVELEQVASTGELVTYKTDNDFRVDVFINKEDEPCWEAWLYRPGVAHKTFIIGGLVWQPAQNRCETLEEFLEGVKYYLEDGFFYEDYDDQVTMIEAMNEIKIREHERNKR